MGITCGCVPLKLNNSQYQIHSLCTGTTQKVDLSNLDYHLHSKLSWICLNDIRIHPEKYSKLISESLSLLSGEKSPENQDSSMLPLQQFLDTFLKSNEEMLSIITELGAKINSLSSIKKNSIEWNEELYTAISDAFKKNKENNINKEEVLPSVVFSSVTKKNLRVVEYNLNGYYDPEITIWKLLLEHKEKTNDILSDNYIYGISYSSCEDERRENFMTKFYFMFELNIDDVIINGVNPITGNYQPLTLNETFLKDINYKDNIVGGSYVFTGEEVNIIFMLSDGTKKEEKIKLDKAEL